ncbi:hypothetical protein OHAE_5097 [Ochrobactrum soli]|uniref:Uncharacterized protein n=1 Tax=Ochrobactrum soli TaxID=2448455 RepID=A0A2P9HFB6_9HYPH|nr:hypothetical protein OHAE_5097 [[Ochrobactrum] soli]
MIKVRGNFDWIVSSETTANVREMEPLFWIIRGVFLEIRDTRK